MRINVRHEEATEAENPPGSQASPEQACVWVVGDDGETISTEYLKSGEQVSIELAADAKVVSSTGEVGPIAQAPPAAETAEPDGGSEVEPGAASVDEPDGDGELEPGEEEGHV